MIHLITYNVNGIRAAATKGFFDWLKNENPDIICLQEIKADESQINIAQFESLGYKPLFAPAKKKGYSGVALLTKFKPESEAIHLNIEAYDAEGRWLGVVIKDVLFISAYFPSGTSGDIRQQFKYKFLDDILPVSDKLLKQYKNAIISGDFNICHKPIDIHDPVSNKNSSGFLPEERQWMDRFFDCGWVDAFRKINSSPHQYSWWSYRADARKKNKGWRIDYHAVSDSLASQISNSRILSEVVHSDHCPVSLHLDI
jgi:exodeoxyribonuclease-3